MEPPPEGTRQCAHSNVSERRRALAVTSGMEEQNPAGMGTDLEVWDVIFHGCILNRMT